MRIESSEANAKGFDVEEDKEHLEKSLSCSYAV